MRKVSIAVCLFWAGTMWAQSQVATVTSLALFTLRGAAVSPDQGVPVWPILAGDSVKGGNAVTVVAFPEGSALTLDPRSEAKLDVVDGKPTFQLLSGTARYSLKSTSAVQLMAANRRVNPASMTGTLRAQAAGAAGAGTGAPGASGTGATGGGSGNGTPVAAIASVVAAAGVEAGVAIYEATKGGPSVSGSN